MQNLKISTKVLLIVLGMAVLSLAIISFAAYRMKAIDDRYSVLLDTGAQAPFNMARSNRLITTTVAQIYQMVAEPSAAGMKRIEERMVQTRKDVHSQLDKVRDQHPASAPAVKALGAEYDRLFDVAMEAAKATQATEDAKAMSILHDRFDEPVAALQKNAIDLADQVIAALNKESDDATAKTWSTIYISLGVALASLVLGSVIALAIARNGISGPISDMTDALRALSEGNAQAHIPGQGRSDEIGRMAQAAKKFKDALEEAEQLRARQEEDKKRAEAERRKATLDLADNFERSVGDLVKNVATAATEMQASAQSMTVASAQTQQQADAVSTIAGQTTHNVQTVASATEELTASFNEINQRVAESAAVIRRAVDDARNTMQMVTGLKEASQKINSVVGLINDIAAQTNLLALNATIEAARAGEAGKGFAVVASEVKILATQTAKATDDIKTEIEAIQGATQGSVAAIESISETINRVNEISTGIAAAVEQQAKATNEISRNVSQAAQGTEQVTTNIDGVSLAAQSTSAAASQVLAASAELTKSGERLSAQVETFLTQVRAA